MKTSHLLLLLFIIGISSCTKEFDTTEIINEEETAFVQQNVETNLFIKVIDYSPTKTIVSRCIINDIIYPVDDNGFLVIPNILLDTKGQLVKIEADGYLPSIHSVTPSLGDITYLKIRLTQSQSQKTFDANLGGTFSIGDSEYNVPPQSVIDGNGDLYLGTVIVENFSRSSALFASRIGAFPHSHIPGLEDQSIQSYGGHDIFLKDENGNDLGIKPDTKITASIEIKPIDNTVIPSDMEVLIFDEEASIWDVVDMSTMNDEKYAIEIPKFGFIRWGTRLLTTQAKVLIDSEDGPLTDIVTMVYKDGGHPISLAYSNDKGYAYVRVPKDEGFTIRSLTSCQPFITFNDYNAVGEATDDIVTLPRFTGFDESVSIRGSIVDCNNQAVGSGILQIKMPLQIHYYMSDENGNFDISLASCETPTLKANVYDLSTSTFSDEFEITYDASAAIDFGVIQACQ